MPSKRQRTWVYLGGDDKQRLGYWADKKGVSESDYATQAVLEAIARENGDFDIPTLGIARLNQLIDQVAALTGAIANLERVVVVGLESLLGMARGDNYLLDSTEDGELES